MGYWSQQVPHVVQIARLRGNRKVYRMPADINEPRRGRPQLYGAEMLLQDPSQPDLEEITTMISRKGRVYQVLSRVYHGKMQLIAI